MSLCHFNEPLLAFGDLILHIFICANIVKRQFLLNFVDLNKIVFTNSLISKQLLSKVDLMF